MKKCLSFLITLFIMVLTGNGQTVQSYIRVEARKKMLPETPYQAYDTRTVGNLFGYHKSVAIPALSKYGGLADQREPATGFFHVKKIGDRWWGIDPEGCRYINMAVNSISVGGSERNKKALAEKFGTKENWLQKTIEMLVENGFNCAGSWSDFKAVRDANKTTGRHFAYTINLNFMSSYGKERGGTFQQPGHTGYPGDAIFVFDPAWEEFCDRHARQVTEYKADPDLFGTFLIMSCLLNSNRWTISCPCLNRIRVTWPP
ncbi:MAG TPA: hypothetical protein PKJ24_09305 [Prolixibacteraceae bacterium]|nr:hypothetical protein [Prolixibacteraceae bacterium]